MIFNAEMLSEDEQIQVAICAQALSQSSETFAAKIGEEGEKLISDDIMSIFASYNMDAGTRIAACIGLVCQEIAAVRKEINEEHAITLSHVVAIMAGQEATGESVFKEWSEK